MRCLTLEECSGWLHERGIKEVPYGRKLGRKERYLQFAPPTNGNRGGLIGSLFGASDGFSGALMHLTDWAWDPEYEEDPIASLRSSAGETRPLVDVPGFVFDHGELTSAVDLGSIVLGRGWTSYVYLTSGVATFLFWEGALIDYWSTDQGLSKQLKAMLRGIGARIVHDR